jgi:protein tyrosine/serine phosphatase
MKKNWVLFLLSIFLISLNSKLSAQNIDFKSIRIRRFYKVDEGFYRGAQPGEKDFETLKTLGIRTIISLRNNKRVINWEKEICFKYGLGFINIPLTARKGVSKHDAKKFLDVVLNLKYRPVFVHCQHGTDRTGCMVTLYRIVYYNWSHEKAYKEALKFGFHRFYYKYREFILKDASRYKKLYKKIKF